LLAGIAGRKKTCLPGRPCWLFDVSWKHSIMARKTPNILLITSDQQHFSALGSVNPRISTPALDGLMADGRRFDRAYCPNPTCTPSRASILTGMMPSEHGAWTLGTKLQEDVPTVSSMLSGAGYRTSLIGKAHFQPLLSTPEFPSIECMPTLRDLDFWRSFHGPWYGFDHVETARMHAAEFLVGGHYAAWMEDRGLKNWQDYFESWPPDAEKKARIYSSRSWDFPEEFHYSTWTAERTIAAIDAAESEPFFIWSSFHDPHPPYLVPEPWASTYDPADMEPGSFIPGEHDQNAPHFRAAVDYDADFWKKACDGEVIHGAESNPRDDETLRKNMACYYGMTSLMDREIGRILAALEASGKAEDTLVVFTSDHGHFLGQHGLTAKAIHMYEDVLRVPFLVRWPGEVSMGPPSTAMQSLVDLAPTFLAAAGLEIPTHMTGRNQLPSWKGEEAVRDHVIVENHHGTRVFHMRTLVTERWKITVYRDGAEGELFDLENDPGEVRNLWHDPAFKDAKARMLHEFLQQTLRDEPMRMPRIAHA
jgi:arylsulfatase A-like enzyme